MDQGKFVEDNICLNRPYPFKFLKDCLPQILLGPFLNILSHINQHEKSQEMTNFVASGNKNKNHILIHLFLTLLIFKGTLMQI